MNSTTGQGYTIQKDREGWEAKTTVSLGEATTTSGEKGERVLAISTHKAGKVIVTSALSTIKYTSSSGLKCESWDLTGDFNKRLMVSPTRASKQTIEAQHKTALLNLAEVTANAMTFYGIPF